MSSLAAACAGLIGQAFRQADGEGAGHGAGGSAMPWLDPYRAIGGHVAHDVMAGQPVAEALNAALHRALSTTSQPPWREPPAAASAQRIEQGIKQGIDQGIAQRAGTIAGHDPRLADTRRDTRSLRFVSQATLPNGEPYEAFIARTGCVPTRDNAHDLFNGLVWLRFPRIKRRLNWLHAAEITRDGVGCTRGAVRDALTLFDENAALWAPPAELADALARRDWHRLFVTHRPLWRTAPLILFGHALLEKLVLPRKAITAHAWLVSAEPNATLRVDRSLSDRFLGTADLGWAGSAERTIESHFAESLTSEQLAAKACFPIPVLGVPGWWSDNERPGFYDDSAVFRAPRASG